jgi:hypothetical protein
MKHPPPQAHDVCKRNWDVEIETNEKMEVERERKWQSLRGNPAWRRRPAASKTRAMMHT